MSLDWITDGDLRFVEAFTWRGDDDDLTCDGAIIAHRGTDSRRYEPVSYAWIPFLTEILSGDWNVVDYPIHRYAFDAAVVNWETRPWGEQAREYISDIAADFERYGDFPYMFTAVSRLWLLDTSRACARCYPQDNPIENPAKLAACFKYYLDNMNDRGTTSTQSIDFSVMDCKKYVNNHNSEKSATSREVSEYLDTFHELPESLTKGILHATIDGEDTTLPSVESMDLVKR